ncbi:MAG: hypothetical protein M1319_01100 [Chloroflexi bacterium]|nr:hypothetical protein [Chloroflexota bacterium]
MTGLSMLMSLFMALSSLLWSGSYDLHSVALAQAGSAATILRFGEDVTVGAGEKVTGDVVVFNGNVVVNGEVTGSVTAVGGNVTVNGKADGDAVAVGGTLHLGSKSFVGGDAVSAGGTVIREQGAMVEGKVVEGAGVSYNIKAAPPAFQFPGEIGPGNAAVSALLSLFRAIGATVFLMVLGLVSVVVSPRATARLADTLVLRPGLSVGIGFLTAFLLPFFLIVGTVVLAITIVGILIIPLFFLAVLLLELFGLAGLGLMIGERVLQSLNPGNTSRLLAAVLGMVLLSVVTVIPLAFVPALGFLLTYLAVAIGLALVVLSRVGTVSPSAPALSGPVA